MQHFKDNFAWKSPDVIFFQKIYKTMEYRNAISKSKNIKIQDPSLNAWEGFKYYLTSSKNSLLQKLRIRFNDHPFPRLKYSEIKTKSIYLWTWSLNLQTSSMVLRRCGWPTSEFNCPEKTESASVGAIFSVELMIQLSALCWLCGFTKCVQ